MSRFCLDQKEREREIELEWHEHDATNYAHICHCPIICIVLLIVLYDMLSFGGRAYILLFRRHNLLCHIWFVQSSLCSARLLLSWVFFESVLFSLNICSSSSQQQQQPQWQQHQNAPDISDMCTIVFDCATLNNIIPS